MRPNPIVNTMVPSQRATVQSIPNPREFSPTDWKFGVNRAYQVNWTDPLQYDTSSDNYFNNNEEWRPFKNSMFNPLTGREPVFGEMNYNLNPLDQEQTNSQTAAYKMNGITRVQGNMNPIGVMRAPPYQYPSKPWQSVYIGSMAGAPMR